MGIFDYREIRDAVARGSYRPKEVTAALGNVLHLPQPGSAFPAELPIGIGDGRFVDAYDAAVHESALIERSKLIAAGAKPRAGIVMPFVAEGDADAVIGEAPERLRIEDSAV